MPALYPIRRKPQGQLRVDKGQWLLLRRRLGSLSATVCCPLCGMTGTLEDHTINNAGEVQPSLACMNEIGGCSFHEYVCLDGWADAVRESEKIID